MAKQVATEISGCDPAGPIIPIVAELSENWNDIVATGIDYQNLVTLYWPEARRSTLGFDADLSKEFLRIAHSRNVFPRDDYNELCTLALVYLGEDVPLRFQKPGPCHKARFMASAIYYIKVRMGYLLSKARERLTLCFWLLVQYHTESYYFSSLGVRSQLFKLFYFQII